MTDLPPLPVLSLPPLPVLQGVCPECADTKRITCTDNISWPCYNCAPVILPPLPVLMRIETTIGEIADAKQLAACVPAVNVQLPPLPECCAQAAAERIEVCPVCASPVVLPPLPDIDSLIAAAWEKLPRLVTGKGIEYSDEDLQAWNENATAKQVQEGFAELTESIAKDLHAADTGILSKTRAFKFNRESARSIAAVGNKQLQLALATLLQPEPATSDWQHTSQEPWQDGVYEIQQTFGEIHRLEYRAARRMWYYPSGGSMCCEHDSLHVIASGWRGLTYEAYLRALEELGE